MKEFGSNIVVIFIVLATMAFSGCKKDYDESFSMWLVFGSSDSPSFTNPVKLEIYEEAGNTTFASLSELRNKQNVFTVTDTTAIANALAGLRSKADGPMSIRNVAKTVHIVAYQGATVGYVKYSIVSENGGEVGFAMPIQSETSSVLGNVAFIKWLNEQKVALKPEK